MSLNTIPNYNLLRSKLFFLTEISRININFPVDCIINEWMNELIHFYNVKLYTKHNKEMMHIIVNKHMDEKYNMQKVI